MVKTSGASYRKNYTLSLFVATVFLISFPVKTLEWTVSAQEAFQDTKRLLAVAVPLQHPAPNAELSLATDASDTHIGGVMQQKSGDHWGPLGFFSRKLTDTESHYSMDDTHVGSPDRQTPPPSGGIFQSFSRQWSCNQLGKMCVCSTFS